MTDRIVILLILFLLVLLIRRELYEVLRTLAERIIRVKSPKWFDVTFTDPADRSEISVVSVAITQEASSKPTKAKRRSELDRAAKKA
jgi:hypothetical protein